jgi:hypothetical protein
VWCWGFFGGGGGVGRNGVTPSGLGASSRSARRGKVRPLAGDPARAGRRRRTPSRKESPGVSRCYVGRRVVDRARGVRAKSLGASRELSRRSSPGNQSAESRARRRGASSIAGHPSRVATSAGTRSSVRAKSRTRPYRVPLAGTPNGRHRPRRSTWSRPEERARPQGEMQCLVPRANSLARGTPRTWVWGSCAASPVSPSVSFSSAPSSGVVPPCPSGQARRSGPAIRTSWRS